MTSSPSERRSPSPEVVNAPPDVTGVSGFLRDATTGAPIHNGCVAWRPASATSTATNGTTGIGDKGKWSINTGDPGPFYIAFYVTDDRRTAHKRLLLVLRTTALPGTAATHSSEQIPSPLCRHATPIRSPPEAPSWPALAGTTPCRRPARSPTEPPRDGWCARETCRSATPASSHWDPITCWPTWQSVNADGRWKLIGLPINYDYIVGAIPSFQTREGPCGENDEGPPPAPPPGALQPEFYDDTWADLAELRGRDDAFTWATDPNSPHPAVTLRNNQTGIDFCLTTETVRETERSSCDPTPTPTPTASASASTSPALAATGGSSPLTPAVGAGLLLGAIGLSWIVRLRRKQSRSASGSGSDRTSCVRSLYLSRW